MTDSLRCGYLVATVEPHLPLPARIGLWPDASWLNRQQRIGGRAAGAAQRLRSHC